MYYLLNIESTPDDDKIKIISNDVRQMLIYYEIKKVLINKIKVQGNISFFSLALCLANKKKVNPT